MTREVFMEIKNLSKEFPPIVAVNNLSLQINRGEIKGLIGENGSGKSTISSVISGIFSQSAGEMYLEGKKYNPATPLEARDAGIAMIVQEKGTIDNLSVAENIFLGDEYRFRNRGLINKKAMNKAAGIALQKIGIDNIKVKQSINNLNLETRKLIEIARAVYYDPELLIIDETTTALSNKGREILYNLIKKFKENNKMILFISHDIEELIDVCDNLTVLRDGQKIKTIEKGDFDEQLIKKTMVGREIKKNFYRNDYESIFSKQPTIRVKNIFYHNLNDISFDLHQGEILGIGGLSGSGMHELGKLMFAMYKPLKGQILIYDKQLKNVKMAMENRIGYVAKERDKETLILNASIKDNLIISALDKLKKYFFISPRSEKEFAEKQIDNLNIKCQSMNQLVGELSGGNKQKVSFAKWLGNDSKILILDSPTRGIDVGVKAKMYSLIYKLKKEGYSIVFISEELQELIGMSDRILILKDGRLNKEFIRSSSLTEADIIKYMI